MTTPDQVSGEGLCSDNDYGRNQISGMQGQIMWESLLKSDNLDGWVASDSPWTSAAWSRDGDAIVTQPAGGEQARLVLGDTGWSHYEFKVQGSLVQGQNLQIHFGISEDDQEWFFLDFLAAWKAISITRADLKRGEFTKLDVINFNVAYNREYDIVLAVRGNSVTSYIDGTLTNRVTLNTNPNGPIALATWGRRTIARFRDPKIRHYFKV